MLRNKKQPSDYVIENQDLKSQADVLLCTVEKILTFSKLCKLQTPTRVKLSAQKLCMQSVFFHNQEHQLTQLDICNVFVAKKKTNF
jgi:hypothetical protein